ncbi:hypothetical protein GCM10027345_20520 [Hymenobacter daeguensis]
MPGRAAAQIGAEAQGGKLTSWVAFGFDKELSERWTSVTDVGFGRHSDPTGDLNPVKRQGLLVLTQDFIYRLSPHWRTAVSAGYWRRNAYSEEAPYDASQPNRYRNELRPFQKLYYDTKFGKVLFTNTLRADYRFYFTPDFGRWPTPFEFRARDMVSAAIPLDEAHRHWLIVSDEVLTASDDYSAGTAEKMGHHWSPYKLTENRASLYYRRSFSEHKLNWDIGIMHQRWRETQQTAFGTSYNLMMDFLIK